MNEPYNPYHPYAPPSYQGGYAPYEQYPPVAPYYPQHSPPKKLAPGKPLRQTSNRLGWTLIVVIAMMFTMSILPALFLKSLGYSSVGQPSEFRGYTPVLYYLADMATRVLTFSLPVFAYIKLRHVSFADVLPSKKVKVDMAFAYFFIAASIALLANIPAGVVMRIVTAVGLHLPSSQITVSASIPATVLSYFATAVIPGFFEELVFRGLIISQLRKYGDKFAVFASALLFASLHGNISQMVFAFIAGLALGWVLVKTNCIWLTVTLHVFNNAVALTGSVLGYYFGASANGIFFLSVLLICVTVGIIFTVVMKVRKNNFFRFTPSAFSIPKCFGAFFANPAIPIFMALCFAEATLSLLGIKL